LRDQDDQDVEVAGRRVTGARQKTNTGAAWATAPAPASSRLSSRKLLRICRRVIAVCSTKAADWQRNMMLDDRVKRIALCTHFLESTQRLRRTSLCPDRAGTSKNYQRQFAVAIKRSASSDLGTCVAPLFASFFTAQNKPAGCRIAPPADASDRRRSLVRLWIWRTGCSRGQSSATRLPLEKPAAVGSIRIVPSGTGSGLELRRRVSPAWITRAYKAVDDMLRLVWLAA